MLAIAISTNHQNASALLPYVDGKPSHHYISTSDPIATMDLHATLGEFTQKGDDFAVCVGNGGRSGQCWARLRNGQPLSFEQSSYDRFFAKDVFKALEESSSVTLWILASREPGFAQHPLTGDTIFHALCKSTKLRVDEKVEIFEELKRDFRNPLVQNFQSLRAIDLCQEPLLKQKLASYMLFQPHRLCMNWYGPFFRSRVFCLLLVLKRFHISANKDVRVLLIRYLARVEILYARAVKNKTSYAHIII